MGHDADGSVSAPGQGGGGDGRSAAATIEAVAASMGARVVVLVEGLSDRVALEALAARRGRDLGAEGVVIVPMGGATNIRRYIGLFGPGGRDIRLAGLCDLGEEREFRRALEQAGLGMGVDRAAMEALGFFVCDADLEDELIRALGVPAVEGVIAEAGELGSYRTFQKQAAQQDRTPEQRLRRFMSTRGGRKIRYAQLLVDALDLDRVPRPLDELLAWL